MDRAVVAGGAGFIGSHLCEHLLGLGMSVVCVDNLLSGSLRNIRHLSGNPDFSFLEADVCSHLTISGPVTYVFNLASPASPRDYLRWPLETLRAGSLGTMNTLELAAQKGAAYLLTSTSEVYGDPLVHPQPEYYFGNVNPIGPRSVYDEAKRFAEAAVMCYHRSRSTNTHIARLFNTYGPRMRLDDGRVVPSFIGSALAGEPLTVFGDGKQTRSLCYVADIVRGLWLLIQSDEHTPVNLGSIDERTVLDLAEIIKRLAGSSSPVVHKEALPDDPRVRRPDINKARMLGWRPTTPLDTGLQATLEYFRQQIT